MRPLRLALLLLLAPVAAAQPAADSVRAGFETYKQAILDRDGAAATAAVNAATLAYYGDMLDLARYGVADSVRALRFVDQFLILSARHRVPADTLAAFDPAGFFAYAVTHGWVGDEVVQTGIADVAVEGGRAEGVIAQGGVARPEVPVRWVLTREAGTWKMDLTALLDVANEAMLQGFEDEDPGAFAIELLGYVSEHPVPDTIWEPPFTR